MSKINRFNLASFYAIFAMGLLATSTVSHAAYIGESISFIRKNGDVQRATIVEVNSATVIAKWFQDFEYKFAIVVFPQKKISVDVGTKVLFLQGADVFSGTVEKINTEVLPVLVVVKTQSKSLLSLGLKDIVISNDGEYRELK